MFEQIKLDYDFDSLEPHIDTLTMETHYKKHHATYTKNFVVDPIKHRVFDVLYSRKGTCPVDYFKSLDQSKRMKVQYFSCDMNKTFIDLARIYFPNAKIVIDRYHFVRQVYWALENVRKRIQKRMLPSLRKYYKRSKSLITKSKAKLSNDNRAALE